MTSCKIFFIACEKSGTAALQLVELSLALSLEAVRLTYRVYQHKFLLAVQRVRLNLMTRICLNAI
jgi:hypothetical protein